MIKKNLKWILGTLALAAVVVIAILAGGPSKLFQSALYNVRPIYKSCLIESNGKVFSNDKKACEFFNKDFQDGKIPDGEYTITAEYTDAGLTKNVIPVKISKSELSCSFLEKGYKPQLSTYSPGDLRTMHDVQPNETVQLDSTGMVVQLKYQKDGQNYFYDTNICESGFQGLLSYAESTAVNQTNIKANTEKNIGIAKLDYNGFINSRPRVNEILINDAPYYQDGKGVTSRNFQPGNIFLRVSAAPETMFQMNIPCSVQIPTVKIPNVETTKQVAINFQGISPSYFKSCGSRLYISLQQINNPAATTTNNNSFENNIQVINAPSLSSQGDSITYNLDPNQIADLQNPATVYPASFKLNMLLKDSANSNQVYLLGSGIVTFTSYKISKNSGLTYNGDNTKPSQSTPPSTTAPAAAAAPTGIVRDQVAAPATAVGDQATRATAITAAPDAKQAPSYFTRPKVRRSPTVAPTADPAAAPIS